MSEQIVTSEKHPNWTCTIEKLGNRTNYYMQHKTYRYMLALMRHDGEWYAELLTRATIHGETSWEPANNNFFKPLEEAKAEVERRGAFHTAKGVWS